MEAEKNIRDSLKHFFADASVDYMQFLEECRKAEEEGKVGQAKAKVMVKAAAATLPPTKDHKLSRQLKYQRHQIDALVGQVKNLVSVVKATQPSSREARTGPPLMIEGLMGQELLVQGEEALGERANPLSQEPLTSPKE